MYKDHKIVLSTTGISAFILSYFLKLDYDNDLLNGIMTVLSIIMGFNVTAISALYSRKFIVNLHRRVDKEIPGQTQLQTLKSYFAKSSKTSLVTIMYLIIYQLLRGKCSYMLWKVIDVEVLLSSIILPLVLMNVILILFLLKVFLSGLIAEADNQ